MNFVDEVIKALEYICKTERGYRHELLEHVSEKLINQFEIVGFIHSGYTLKYRTWSVTSLGKQYYKEIK